MSTNAETVRRIQEAMGKGDLLAPMAHLAKDVHWRVNVTDRSAAPWFGDYQGRRGVLAFFEAMDGIEFTTYDVVSVVGDDDVIVVWLRLAFTAPTGRHVVMDECEVWVFEDAKVKEVEIFPDTLAIAAAFA